MGHREGNCRRGEPKGNHREARHREKRAGRALPEGTGEGAPVDELHVFLEGEVVVGEVGVEVEFTEVYFFIIGGGVV